MVLGERKEARLKNQVAELQNRIDEFPDQPRRIIAVLEHYDNLELQSAAPVPVLAAIADSLEPSIRLKTLRWEAEDVRGGAKKNRSKNVEVREPGFSVDLVVDLGAFTDAEQAIAATNNLAERLSDHFAEQVVEIVRQPLNILPTQTLTGSNSEDTPETIQIGLSAAINIDGILK